MRRSYRWRTGLWQKVLGCLCACLVFVFAFASRINVYELMFHPLDRPTFSRIPNSKVDGKEEVVSIRVNQVARAYPVLMMSYHQPVLLVVGGDGQWVRVVRRRIPRLSSEPNFYRIVNRSTAAAVNPQQSDALFMDAETGIEWDYWFDWRNYHPATTVYGINVRSDRDGYLERKDSPQMTEEDVISNQKTILSNQQQIISHQKLILENQETIKKNQETLDTIVANQEKIQALLKK